MPKFAVPVSLRVCGPRARVYEAWVSPKIATHWQCDKIEGVWQPGEVVTWHYFEHRQSLRVLSVDPNHKLAFTWRAWATEAEIETKVEILFADVGDQTSVKVREEGWELSTENVAIAIDHACGWENMLCRLKNWIETGARFSSETGAFSIPSRD